MNSRRSPVAACPGRQSRRRLRPTAPICKRLMSSRPPLLARAAPEDRVPHARDRVRYSACRRKRNREYSHQIHEVKYRRPFPYVRPGRTPPGSPEAAASPPKSRPPDSRRLIVPRPPGRELCDPAVYLERMPTLTPRPNGGPVSVRPQPSRGVVRSRRTPPSIVGVTAACVRQGSSGGSRNRISSPMVRWRCWEWRSGSSVWISYRLRRPSRVFVT
jgi:hypothetical protein